MNFFSFFFVIIGVCVTLVVSSPGVPPPTQKCDCSCPISDYTILNPNCHCPSCPACDCFCPPRPVIKECEAVCSAQSCGDIQRY